MRFSLFAFVGSLVTSVVALPASTPYELHERRSDSSWREVIGRKPDARTVLPVRIGLTQNNLDKGYDFLMDVSDPSSPNFGNHWTAEKV